MNSSLTIGITDELVCRVVSSHQPRLVQIMIPHDKNIKADVLKLAHDHPMSGHLGVAKSISRLLRHFYWPGITRDVKTYIKGCTRCQVRKTVRPLQYDTALRSTIPNTIDAGVGIDLIGPLPLVCQYLCVMIDYFSK